jgi:hypothetical protein
MRCPLQDVMAALELMQLLFAAAHGIVSKHQAVFIQTFSYLSDYPPACRLMSAPDVVLNGIYGRTLEVNQLGPDMAFAHTLLNSGFASKVCTWSDWLCDVLRKHDLFQCSQKGAP